MKKVQLLLVLCLVFSLFMKEGYAYSNKEKSGKTVYGFCIYNENWGALKPLGLYSFNTTNPSVITKVWSTNLNVDAAAYYDGYYYAQTSVHNGATYLSMDFGKFDAATGEYTKIADWSDKLHSFTDMTIDYSTNPPSLIGLKAMSVGDWRLVRIDMYNGDVEYISNSNSTGSFFGLACGHDGTIYTINRWTDGNNLQTIDRTTGRLNTIGDVGISPKFLQSMDFDHTDGTLYWAATDGDLNGRLGTLDPATGKYTNLGTLGNNAEFVGLHIPIDIGEPGTPAPPTALKVTPADNGVKTSVIEWKVPTLDNTGIALANVTAVKLYRNNQLIQTFNNPAIGSTGTFTDNVPSNGIYFYKVTAENSFGVSVATQARVYIGEDRPLEPTNIVLTRNGLKGILTWTPPTKGINGGWINTSKLKYKISRRQGFSIPTDISSGTTGNTFTDNNVPENGSYTYTVHSLTDVGTGHDGQSNPLYIGTSLSMPYNCVFTEKQWNLWTVVDSNKDMIGWRYYNNDEDIVHCSKNRDNASDDWLISPPITLAPGSYKLTFEYKAKSINKHEKMKVFCGQGELAELQTDLLLSIDDFNNINFDKKTAVIIVTSQGDYNFSFYACSDADQEGMQITNVKLENMIPNDMEALSVKGEILPVVNAENIYNITIRNAGSATQNSYTVQLIDDKNNVLSSIDSNESIIVNETKVFPLSWTPTETGLKKVRGKVILTGDQNANNNLSNPLQIEVQPEGYNIIPVGDGTIETGGLPFDLTYRASVQQMLYLKEEIGNNGGMINKIIYPYNIIGNSTFSTPKALKVYLANTELTTLDGGWIPDYEFTKVFDATVQILPGEGYIILTLSKPFLYSGENLCVMCNRVYDMELFYNLKFYMKETTSNRAIRYGSYYNDFNGTQQGLLTKVLPNMLLQIDSSQAGMMEGTVTCQGTPIEGVNVNINSLGISVTTDASGHYYFGYVPAGTYNVTTSKHGYSNNTVMGIVVNQHITTTNDIAIQELPVYAVSGNVKDVDSKNLQGAIITVTGYESYTTTTDENGNFSIPNVYKANGYSIRVKSMGLEPYYGSFNIVNTSIDLGTIVLKDIIKAPVNVTATLNSSSVDLTWDEPLATITFRYDDGIVAGYRGFPNGTVNSVLGSVHRVPAVLESMSWYTGGELNYGGPHTTVNVFVFDLDENGNPTNNIIFNQMNVPNVDDVWTSFKFPHQINCPNGFMIALSYAGYLGLGRDEGNSQQWPYVPQTNYNCVDFNYAQFFYEGGTKTFSYMLRAEGYDMSRFEKSGELQQSATRKVYGYSNTTPEQNSVLDVSCSQKSTNYEDQTYSDSKSIKGYKVWRLKDGDENSQSKWTLLTANQIASTSYKDTEWSSLQSGAYKYAVRTVYTNETSLPSFSQMIPKDMLNDVTIHLTTNTPVNEAAGAVIKFTNNDNKPEHVYFTTADSDGKALIKDVWKGTYKVNVYAYGFENIEDKNVIVADQALTLNYELREIVSKPSNLQILTTGVESERIFNWEGVSFNNIFDDFERHTDFKINSKSSWDWTYIDGDGAETTGIESVNFPNQGAPMAYIIFNPSKTQPAVNGDEALAAREGSKYQATFAVYAQPNQDYIISPELLFPTEFVVSFWAKSYVSNYGLERFKVGYSLTGNNKSDFSNWVTPGNYVQVPTKWTKYSYTIPKEARYVTIECVSNDAFIFMLDDIFIGIESSRSISEYEVYLDGNKVANTEESTYKFTKLEEGKHIAGVKSVFTSSTSDMSVVEFKVGPTGVNSVGNTSLKLYPNPVQDILTIDGDYTAVKIFNEIGKLVISSQAVNQINFRDLPSGIYVVEFSIDKENTETHRVIKK